MRTDSWPCRAQEMAKDGEHFVSFHWVVSQLDQSLNAVTALTAPALLPIQLNG